MTHDTRQGRHLRRLPTAFLALLLCSGLAQAAGEQFKMNINISGTVVATGSCTFNAGSGATLGVDFGRVRYTTTSGFALEGEYRRALNSAMTCTGDTDGTAMMTLDSADSSAILSDGHRLLPVALNGVRTSNLGIMLRVNGTEQDVGRAFSVDMASPPALDAELVQVSSDGSVDNGAALTASATLTMAFQ